MEGSREIPVGMMMEDFLEQGTLALWSMPEGECKDSTCLYVLSGEGNGNPLQYSCLENPMDGEAWQAREDSSLWTH